MTASNSCVYVCLLTAPDCCETHRENSLFPFQSEAQATSITSDRERGRAREGAGSDRWRKDLNSERIFSCLKLEYTSGYIRKRNAGVVMRWCCLFSPSLLFFNLSCLFLLLFFSCLTPTQPLKYTHAYTLTEKGFLYSLSWSGQTRAGQSSFSLVYLFVSTSFLSIFPSSKIDH